MEGPVEEANVYSVFDSTQQQRAVRSDTSLSFNNEILAEKLPSRKWFELILSLNDKQYQLHKFIVGWATQMVLSHRVQKPEPFHLFLTGGAGVGKSHLVRTIVQTVNILFAINLQAQDSHVLVCAPTGAAACNISGVTCHSAFLLPFATKNLMTTFHFQVKN